VREHVWDDARVGCGADEVENARPDEEDRDADGRIENRQRVESRE
jgi:hypothetical protein